MGGKLSVSTEYHTLGKTSIKSTKTTTEASVDMQYSISSNEWGKTVTFIFDAYSPDNTNIFLCYRDVNSAAHIDKSLILPLESSTHITLSTIVPDESTAVFLRLSNSISSVYITNITLNIQ